MLSGPMVHHGNAQAFMISPDGSRVVYTADQDANGTNEIYSVAISGGEIIKLNEPHVSNYHSTGIRAWYITEDSSALIYNRFEFLFDTRKQQYHLLRVPLLGGPSVVIDTTEFEQAGRSIDGEENRGLVFLRRNGSEITSAFRVDSESVLTLINPPSDGRTINRVRIVNDGKSLLYELENSENGTYQLFLVNIVTGQNEWVSPKLDQSAGNYYHSPVWIAESNQLLTHLDANEDGSSPSGLYLISASQTTLIIANTFGESSFADGLVTPDQQTILYRFIKHKNEDNLRQSQWFQVPVSGGVPTPLTPPEFYHRTQRSRYHSLGFTEQGDFHFYSLVSGTASFQVVRPGGSSPNKILSVPLPPVYISSTLQPVYRLTLNQGLSFTIQTVI